MIDWNRVSTMIEEMPVVHFRVGGHRVSVARESKSLAFSPYIIFVDFKLITIDAMSATPLERQLLCPITDENGTVVEYHYSDKKLTNILTRLKSVDDIKLSDTQVTL